MRSSGFSVAEKSAVTAACQHLIDDFLKPRFLPTIRPTQFNYPVDILGNLCCKVRLIHTTAIRLLSLVANNMG